MTMLGRWNWWPGKLSRKPRWHALTAESTERLVDSMH
jgi:hypothetical protein